MNRRGFLGLIGAAVAGSVLDPEKLLWKPGAKVISIPTLVVPEIEVPREFLTVGDIFTMEGFYRHNPRTGKPMEGLQQFVCIHDYTPGKDMHLKYFPSIIPSGQYANVTKTPVKHSRRVRKVPYSEQQKMAVSRIEVIYGQPTRNN